MPYSVKSRLPCTPVSAPPARNAQLAAREKAMRMKYGTSGARGKGLLVPDCIPFGVIMYGLWIRNST